MICSNCHKTTENNFAAEFQGHYYHICDKCAQDIPTEPTAVGIHLYQKINNKATPYKLLTIHNVIKYWESFADVVLKLPGITESELENTLQEITLEELKSLGIQLQELALQYTTSADYAEHWKTHQTKGFSRPYAYQGLIFTIYLTYDEDGWHLSISSPYLHVLPDEFCQQIADCIRPQDDIIYCMGRVSPNSPTMHFWMKKNAG